MFKSFPKMFAWRDKQIERGRLFPSSPLQTQFVLTSICIIIGIGKTDGDRYCRANEEDAEAVIADCLRNQF